jgi:hypothetical protein
MDRAMQQAAEARRSRERGTVHRRIALTLPQSGRHRGGPASRL